MVSTSKSDLNYPEALMDAPSFASVARGFALLLPPPLVLSRTGMQLVFFHEMFIVMNLHSVTHV